MDLATLGLAVDSSQVRGASDELQGFQQAAVGAERATDKLNQATERMLGADGRARDGRGRFVKMNEGLRDYQAGLGGAERATERFEAQAASMDGTLGSLRGTVGAIASAFGVVFGGAAFAAGMLDAVKRMEAIEVASRKIDKALQNNGYTADLTTKKIIAYADALERRTGRAAQDVLDLAPNLASFQFSEEVALRSIALADDMAAAWGGDLRQNFEGLGRALADPVKGFAMLSQRGITLDDTQKKLVKSLMQTGQGLKAQQVVLEALEAQIKGVAEAGYTPLTRAQDNARKSIEKFFEKLVSSQGAGDALIKILNGLANAMTFLGDHIDTITTALGIFTAGHVVSGIVSIVGAVQTMTATMGLATVAARALSLAVAFVGGPIGLAVLALGAAYLLLRDNVTAAQQAVIDGNNAFRTNVQAMNAMETASGKYSQTLRDQVAMQVEVAKSALEMAQTMFDAAARAGAVFALNTGLRSAIHDFNTKMAEKDVVDLSVTVAKLEDQLAKVDANLAKNKPTDRNFGSGDDGKAAERATNAYRDLIKSAQDRIEQMQLEEQLVGKTGVASEALRMKLELLQKAQQHGRTITEAQRKELEGLADQYGAVAARVAELQMAEDLRFERAQMFRSQAEQRVYGDLRNAGIDPESAVGQRLATQIRLNEQLQISADLTKDFASSFVSDMLNGKSAIEALTNALTRLADKLLEMALDSAINALFGNLMGALGGGFTDGAGGGLGALLGYRNGGAFAGGVQMFANGGAFTNSVVSRPTLFPFANGTGLMGEAGPEAIMPLKRDGSGRLGVSAANDRAANNNQPAQYVDQRTYHFTGTSEEFEEFKKFVAHRDAQFDDRAVQAVKRYHKSGNSI